VHPDANLATLPAPAAGPSAAPGGVVGAIPARWGSTRLPGKPLVQIAGRPLVEHVYRRAARAGLARVVVLTDDERVAAAVDRFGGEWQLTPADCASGTDRIAWAARSWPEGAVVNIQGDEPLVDPGVIARLAAHLAAHPDDPVVTFAAPAAAAEVASPHAVKVVLDRRGYALYFSRAAIPFERRSPAGVSGRGAAGDGGGAAAPLKHLGLYGYQRRALLELAALAPSPLETTEALEQLRALENGIPIRVLLTDRASPGVDTGEDLARVEALLAEGG
jgi:3-deoxy-manno-octulosonate cytidylyltransferase (CMP-KDO synthetase)